MRSQLEELKSRVVLMKGYLHSEPDATSVYAQDLRKSIVLCEMQIKQLEYGKANPLVFVPGRGIPGRGKYEEDAPGYDEAS